MRRGGGGLSASSLCVGAQGPYTGEGKQLPDDPGKRPKVPFLMPALLSSAGNAETIQNSRALLGR